jgi:hypothetical protein
MVKRMKTYLCLSLLLLPAIAQALPVVGHISFAKGNSAAQQKNAASRLLGQGAQVYSGDNIQTAERSFVVIEFIDGAKVTVRPNSSFSIDAYNNEAKQKNAVMVLHQGGIQASTGAIAQQQADNFQIKANQTTVIAQQAEYSVQLCDEACAKKENNQAKQAIAARVVDSKGVITAKSASEGSHQRQLALGDALYSTDTISSNKESFALMVFADGEKITLQANSQLIIADYAYHVTGKQDNALFRLVKGGMRALTGAIGKENKGTYAVDTPVATIGIRGTGFDLYCVGDCVADENAPNDIAPILLGQLDGLYSQVWQGQIVLHNNNSETLLSTPNSNYIAAINAAPLAIPALPEMIRHSSEPRPDSNKSDIKQLFAAKTAKAAAGLYFAVHKGQVKLQAGSEHHHNNRSETLKENEQAYVGDNDDKPTRLDEQAYFEQQAQDFEQQQNHSDDDTSFGQDNDNAANNENCND